ncbi:hypothetical protein DFH09DRAFT_1084863 [Mycena vulgaris]|nr:hypothetical protein DFH09DRAFT_1084863 [Mycena vulgaris]
MLTRRTTKGKREEKVHLESKTKSAACFHGKGNNECECGACTDIRGRVTQKRWRGGPGGERSLNEMTVASGRLQHRSERAREGAGRLKGRRQPGLNLLRAAGGDGGVQQSVRANRRDGCAGTGLHVMELISAWFGNKQQTAGTRARTWRVCGERRWFTWEWATPACTGPHSFFFERAAARAGYPCRWAANKGLADGLQVLPPSFSYGRWEVYPECWLVLSGRVLLHFLTKKRKKSFGHRAMWLGNWRSWAVENVGFQHEIEVLGESPSIMVHLSWDFGSGDFRTTSRCAWVHSAGRTISTHCQSRGPSQYLTPTRM